MPAGARVRYWDLTHELAFTGAMFQQLATVTGFSATTVDDDRISPLGWRGVLHAPAWHILRALWLVLLTAYAGGLQRNTAFTECALFVARK